MNEVGLKWNNWKWIQNPILQQVLWKVKTKYPQYTEPKLFLSFKFPPCRGGNIHCLAKEKKNTDQLTGFYNGILTLTPVNTI